MYITVDEEAPFAEQDQPIAPTRRQTVGSQLLADIKNIGKSCISNHKRPTLFHVNWQQRKQVILLHAPLPEALVDLITEYELSVTQKKFYMWKNWCLQYNVPNQFVRSTRYALLLAFCLAGLLSLLYVAKLYHIDNKTDCQKGTNLLTSCQLFSLLIGAAGTIFYTGARNVFHKVGHLDRFILHKRLCASLNAPSSKVTEQGLNTMIINIKGLLARSTRYDSNLFLLTLIIICPLSFALSTMGLECLPEAQGATEAMMVTNTAMLGLAFFGLYKHGRRKALELQATKVLSSNIV